MSVKWEDEPEDHDYDAAADYLSMLAEAATVDATVAALRTAKPLERKAKPTCRKTEPLAAPILAQVFSWQ